MLFTLKDNKQTAALVLAAGNSSRLGTPKQLLKWNGATLIEHCINQLHQAGINDVLVVLGAYSDVIVPVLANLNVRFVHNPNWRSGMGTSIALGVQTIAQGATKQIMLTLCDLPFVQPEHYCRIIEKAEGCAHSIIGSVFNETRGVPTLFKSVHFRSLAKLEGHAGARKVIESNSDVVDWVCTGQPFYDIDILADYEKCLNNGFHLP